MLTGSRGITKMIVSCTEYNIMSQACPVL